MNIEKISPRAAHRVALLFCPVFETQPNQKGNAMPEDGDDSDERDEERFVGPSLLPSFNMRQNA